MAIVTTPFVYWTGVAGLLVTDDDAGSYREVYPFQHQPARGIAWMNLQRVAADYELTLTMVAALTAANPSHPQLAQATAYRDFARDQVVAQAVTYLAASPLTPTLPD